MDCKKTLAGLKAGMWCSGMIIVVFLEMLRAVLVARFLRMKLPKPLRKTSLPPASESFTVSINASTVASTVAFSIPVFWEISFTISAFVMCLCRIVYRLVDEFTSKRVDETEMSCYIIYLYEKLVLFTCLLVCLFTKRFVFFDVFLKAVAKLLFSNGLKKRLRTFLGLCC